MRNQVLGANLLRLRKDRNLTQVRLAELAEISKGAYRNIEKGRAEPRPETLKALSAALNASLKELLAPVRSLSNVRFRSLKRLKSRDQVLAEVTRWLEDFSSLERLVDEQRPHVLRALWDKISDLQQKDPIAIAALARAHFGLHEKEPVHDICGLLESGGIKVFSLKVFSDAFFGLSVSEEDGGPAVIVNTWERLPVETWIFSAAHELGHLLLHLGAFDVTQEQEEPSEEKEADQFASHFLMPEEVFRREWGDAAGLNFVDRVLKVKRVFKVSWRTVLYRVAENFAPDQRFLVWQSFNLGFKSQKGRSVLKHDEPHGITREVYDDNGGSRSLGSEPAGMASYDFKEDRLLYLVRKALDQDEISFSRAAEILSIPLMKMRELSSSWVA
jgi:Zn-dependent peptidase ImmA (M78 family)/transcriptional regulator with XRE-family HTH domain